MSRMRGSPVLERPRESSPAIAEAKPHRPGVSSAAETKRREPRGPALVPHPKAASRAARIGPMRCRGQWAARRASRRRGESEARTAPAAAAMMLGRQIPIADETAQRRHAPEPARPVAVLVAVTSVRRMGVAGGGDLGAVEGGGAVGGTDEGADGARQSPLAMPVGNAAEGAGAANRARCPTEDTA